MDFTTAQLKEILLTSNYVAEEDFLKAEQYAENTKKSILDYFYENEILSEALFNQAVAEYFNLAYANLTLNKPSQNQVSKIPFEIAKELRIVLYQVGQGTITIATDNPTQENFKEKLKSLFPGIDVRIAYASTKEIEEVFKFYRTSLNVRFNKILKEESRITPSIVEEIIRDALDLGTSDIHFEPMDDEVIIRFRVDGVMREASRITNDLYLNILNNIKIQAKLRIDDHFSAQDGSIRYKVDDRRVDLRVSITPTLDGEKIVMRLLGEYIRSFKLKDLGLADPDQDILLKNAHKPFGMILVTGPTGSGKSTTLYSLLKLLNQPDVNITTIEDPVEYKVSGVNQIQVNNKTNLTFAQGLRSIVRQDPDIILVGEIRDVETAEIAVNAALTGHLLLSTFHANDAATAIPRLLDMNVEPFLLSSTLQVIVAQRLVRKICDSCRYTVQMDQKDLGTDIKYLKKYFPEKTFTLYEGAGCEVCNNSGFKGRVAIYEFIEVTPEIQQLILTNPSSNQIWEAARAQGTRSLFEDGLDKVKKGITTLGEVIRVAPPK